MNKIEVAFRKLEENYAEFVIEGITPAIANAIRRTAISDVPTLAIDEVAIVENSTVFFDEIIAHRLGLIPLKVDTETYDVLLECYEEGKRDDCVAMLTLEVEAEKPGTAYSGHLKFAGFIGEFARLASAEVKPVSDLVPIVKLAAGQKLVLEAYAKVGVGREHAKWQPVSIAAYKYYPEIRIIKRECGEEGKKCADACPKGILKWSNGRLDLIPEKVEECTMCRACEEACPEVIKVSWDDSKFIFRVEGLGVIPVAKVIETALKRLIKRADSFVETLEKSIQTRS